MSILQHPPLYWKCTPVSHSPKSPLQPDKLAQHIDKNENVLCQGYCKGEFERQVSSALHGKLAKAWSILNRSMISPTSLTKILWWVCSSSWPYFILCGSEATSSGDWGKDVESKKEKKILCFSEGIQLFGKCFNPMLSTEQEVRAV